MGCAKAEELSGAEVPIYTIIATSDVMRGRRQGWRRAGERRGGDSKGRDEGERTGNLHRDGGRSRWRTKTGEKRSDEG
jgi:hypothetical protein